MISLIMKKLTALASGLGYLLSTSVVFAQENINIKQPKQGIDIFTDLGTVISNVLTIFFSIGVIIVLIFLILGAFDWITSGGEKENVAKARGKILNALIGLAILSLAFLIARIGGQIAGIDIFNLQLPALGPKAGTLTVTPTPRL